MARLKKIGGVYVPIRGDYTEFQSDMAKVRDIARAQGTALSNELSNALSAETVSKRIADLTRSVGTATRASASKQMEPVVKGIESLASVGGLASSEMAKLQQQMLKTAVSQQFERAMSDIKRQTGAGALEMAKLRYALGDTEGALSTLGAAALGAVPAVIAVGLGVGGAAKACFEASLAAERLEKSYTSITGSTAGAKDQLKFLYDVSNKLGLQFQSTAASAKGFFAAGRGTALEGEIRSIFTAVSQAGASLALGQDEMNGIFLALGQMISKGKVQAEELRGQLGERLPGAFQLAAKAMGVTTAELDKMLESGSVTADVLLPKLAQVLSQTYPGAASDAVAATNRLSTEWERFKSSVMNNDGVIEAIQRVAGELQNAANALNDGDAAKKLHAAGVRPEGFSYDKTLFNLFGTPEGVYTRDQLDGFKKYGAYDPADVGMVLRAKNEADQQRSSDSLYERVTGDARSAFTAFNKDSESAKIDKLNESYSELIRKIDAAREAAAKRGEDTAQYAQMERQAADQYVLDLDKIGKKEKDTTDKVRHATERITADLAKMTDVGTEGQGRVAELTKKYDEFANTLGITNSQVRAYAKEIEYAKKHNGFTEAEVAKATRAIELESRALQDRAEAIRESTREDGTVDQQRLALLQARADAQRQYTEDLKKGVEEGVSAKKRDLAISNAEASKAQGDLQARIGFLAELAQLYPADADLQKRILDKKVEAFREAGVAEVDIARWAAREKLKVATDAQSGITRAYQTWSEDATNMAKGFGDMFTNGMNNSSEVVAQFCRTGKLNFRGMVNSWLDDMARLASRQMTSSIFGSILSAVGSAAGSYFGGGLGGGTGGAASGAWGDYADRVVGIAGTRASGGPVLGGNTYLVGENGPELFTPDLAGAIVPNAALAGGAASDNRVLDALASLKDAITNMGGSGSPRIVNVLDQSLVHEAMASSGGEKVILNFIRSNAGAVKAALGTA